MKDNIRKLLKGNNKYVVIGISILLLAVIGVSYGFFVAGSSNGPGSLLNVQTEDVPVLTFTKGADINIYANIDNFNQTTGSLSDSTVATANLKAGKDGTEVTKEYYVYMDITSNNFVYTTDSKEPEMIVKITDPDGNEISSIDGLDYVSVTDFQTGDTITGFDVTNKTGVYTVKSNHEITSSDKDPGVTENWTFEVIFVNIDSDQTPNEGKNMDVEFELTEEKINFLNEYLIVNYDESNGLYQHTTELVNSDQSGDYRYSGSNTEVNNFISFNDETWRIIGIFDTVLADGITTQQLVKIIKEEPIGILSWDTRNSEQYSSGNYGQNDWTTSNINYILLNSYLNRGNDTSSNNCYNGSIDVIGNCDFSTSGIKTEYISFIEDVTYYLGGVSTNQLNSQDLYDFERGNVVYGNRPLTGTSKLGLMYMSDYAYAASSSCWDTLLNVYSGNSVCHDDNWLFQDAAQWTITHYSPYAAHVWLLNLNGNLNYSSGNKGNEIRPTIYLNNDTIFVSGTGIESDPFIISM